ncbi:MAG: hypothetical protein JSS04_24280 [Proteobacteria bacterium]|nr:hypothetical protein [Pseudomonadota bacterium]
MPDLYTLFAKIQTLPKRRIADGEDFVDFLTLRRAGTAAKPSHELKEMMGPLEKPRSAAWRTPGLRLRGEARSS